MKRVLPLVITFLLGTLFVLEFFLPHHAVHELVALLQEWGTVLAATAFILGAINVVQVNVPKVVRRERDWPYKIVLLASAAGMIVLGFVEGKEGKTFLWVYEYVFAPCNSTMFALLAFFIASAAFRAFRARNVEALLMLVTALIVMLTVVPFGSIAATFLPASWGETLTTGPDFVRDWILDYANNSGRRAILIGAALGAVATGLRVILGLERSHLGGD